MGIDDDRCDACKALLPPPSPLDGSQVSLGERRAVTAILVLCGLPYASFSSILAHEAMHAWMKLDPSFPSRLRPQARVLAGF